MSIKNSLGNYFLGKEIKDFYEELKEKNPNKISELNKEKNKYIFWGRVVPSTIEIGGLVALCIQPSLGGFLGFSGSFGAGRSIRDKANQIHYLRKLNYISEKDSA